MRIIITGGAGFIGSHLSRTLLDQGHDVIVIDNLITGNIENIRLLLPRKNFNFIQHDVSKPIFLSDTIDQIYHLASPASPIDYLKLPIQTLKVGALGTYTALGMAMRHNAALLMASTSEVYGDPLVHPQKEDYWGNVNPIGPRGVYDEAKRYAESMVEAYRRFHGVNTHIVRIFNTYGPNMRPYDGRVVPAFCIGALKNEPLPVFGDGEQTRSFCYVSDLVRGLIAMMNSNDPGPINLGNPHEMTIKEFGEIVNSLIKNTAGFEYKELPVDDPKIRQPDISKAIKILKWKPEIAIEQGLQEAIEYFKRFV
ncbi:SDR family oxidoreductase [Candidatus Calescamantes bacterium]|nr:SDR family oxidoreductase [Candidatus Calescamantes bacterium]